MKRPLLPLDEAIDQVIATASALRERLPPSTRVVSIWEASGLVLAEDVHADRPLPPFDKSMMDGYAVRFSDVEGLGRDERRSLKVVGEVAAGGAFADELGPGEAVAIMTGAPIPEGADTVQVVELCERNVDTVHMRGGLRRGENVTRAGAQASAGDVVVERGRVIESLTAGVLASVGREEVEVYRRPRVTVIATGDELVNVEETPAQSQIRDSNRRTLMALAESEWCRVVDGGIIRDDREALRAAIREGLDGDVLVLSGGVSAGQYDYVRECLELEGVDVRFHQIA
ncbi:MAG TPA: molybdopterin molybdotransferase MoeA, partial [Myxococcota bacterium]|nr:molybdopterin molybdotransferase MoeA [Myxococcota bacterium]